MNYGKFIDAEGPLASQLGFLARAVSSDETRLYMNCIHVEPSDKGGLTGVATDGRRLHYVDELAGADVFGITAGFWKVFKNGKRVWIARLDDSETEGFKFPNWRKVLSTGNFEYETYFEGYNNKTNHNQLVDLLRNFPDKTVIDLKHIADLGVHSVWRVEWFGREKAIRFTSGNCTAVIMPKR